MIYMGTMIALFNAFYAQAYSKKKALQKAARDAADADGKLKKDD